MYKIEDNESGDEENIHNDGKANFVEEYFEDFLAATALMLSTEVHLKPREAPLVIGLSGYLQHRGSLRVTFHILLRHFRAVIDSSCNHHLIESHHYRE